MNESDKEVKLEPLRPAQPPYPREPVDKSDQEAKAALARQRAPKLSAEKALPKSGADTLVKIIKGCAVASNGGEAQVNYKDVASAAGINPTTVSGNNSFLLESDILSSPKYGFYIPTENAVRFARESAWDEAGAKAHLRKVVLNCWYGAVVTQNFTLRSILTREQLKRVLAIKCGATEGDSIGLEYLMDFIIYTGIVVANENGTLTKGNFDEMTKHPVDRPAQEPMQRSVGDPSVVSSNQPTPPDQAIRLVVHVYVKNFDDLTPERAARLKEWLRTLQGEQKVGELHLEADA